MSTLLVGARYVTVRANGLEFEVLEAGAGDRLALCLHGFPEHAIMWRPHLATLVELGYRVWAPNQRGYGNTSKPRGVAAYGIDRLLDDVAALADASGASELTLIGHDWGALVAWFFAMRRIRPLARLVTINVPHPACYARVVATSWPQRLRSWYALAFQLPWLPERLLGREQGQRLCRILRNTASHSGAFAEDALAIYAAQVADVPTARAMLAWYRAAARQNVILRLLRDPVPTIDVPTLLLWGEDDHALGKETTYDTHRYVADLRIDYLAGASHWVSEDAPARVNERLVSFLS